MINAAIFDIDNTIFNIDHRLHYIESKPKDWNAFFQSCTLDTPIPSVISFAQQLSDAGHYLIFITGRREEEFIQTTTQLHKHIARPFRLFMRPAGVYEKDYILKENILLKEVLPYCKVTLAVDDKLEVVNVYKKYKIPTLHLTWSNNA